VGENDTTKVRRKLDNPTTRRFLLMTMLDDEPCGFVTDAVYHTGAEDSVNLWSVRCSNRKRYALIVEPYGHMSGRPLTCAELEEFALLLAEPAGEPGDAWHCSPVAKAEAASLSISLEAETQR
jgi:hypothetical protein